jgi:hypothetical protein
MKFADYQNCPEPDPTPQNAAEATAEAATPNLWAEADTAELEL